MTSVGGENRHFDRDVSVVAVRTTARQAPGVTVQREPSRTFSSLYYIRWRHCWHAGQLGMLRLIVILSAALAGLSAW